MGGIECFDDVPCPCLRATVVLSRGISFDVLFSFMIYKAVEQPRAVL